MNKRRFRNYIKHLQRQGHQLNDRQLWCAAVSYGLRDAFEMNRILEELDY